MRAWRRARESTQSHSSGSRYRHPRFQQCTGSATLGAVDNVAELCLYCVQDDYRWWSRILAYTRASFPTPFSMPPSSSMGDTLVPHRPASVQHGAPSHPQLLLAHQPGHATSWAAQIDVLIPAIKPTFNHSARELLRQRRVRLGERQCRAIWGSGSTDDVALLLL